MLSFQAHSSEEVLQKKRYLCTYKSEFIRRVMRCENVTLLRFIVIGEGRVVQARVQRSDLILSIPKCISESELKEPFVSI